jgi:hypothetical protein
MERDSRRLAQRASAYISDSRVQHFWDLWRFGTRTYSEQLGIPPQEAWDMFTFYKPHLIWRSTIPEPTFWMQNRNLEKGLPYNKEELEAEMLKWVD